MEPTDASEPGTYLLAERLDVYQVALEFQKVTVSLLRGRRLGSLRAQLDRASVSIPLNIAEGIGRRTAAEKASFYSIARGSASECGAILDALAMRGCVAPEVHRRARALLIRITRMLTGLIASASGCASPREGEARLHARPSRSRP